MSCSLPKFWRTPGANALTILVRLATTIVLMTFCGVAAAAPHSWADLADPVFRNIGTEQGLPNPVVNTIAEDADGFLWFGTQGGLARWDGYSFRIYRPTPDVAGSLPDVWITVLHTDPRGNLWIGTSAGGLARYDRHNDNFVHYGVGPHQLSGVSISAIADDGVGGLWIGTANGLDHLDPATGRVQALHHIAGRPDSLPDNHIESLLRDRSGTLWVGTRAGLTRRPFGANGFTAVPITVSTKEQIVIASLFQGPDRRVWIGTTKYGAFVASEAGSSVSPVLAPGADGQELAHQWIYAIGIGDSGEIWLGTYGYGIMAIDSATGNARRIRHQADLPRSLANNTIWALYRDHAGGIWVASSNGVGRLTSVNAAVATIFGGSSKTHNISDTDVGSVLSTSDGRIWLGLISNGIDILDPKLGRVATLPANFDAPGKALSNPRILALAEGAGGEVFIGTYHGMYRANAAGTRVTRVRIPGRDPEARTIAFATMGGKLWVGGGNGDGLWLIDPGDPTSRIEHIEAGKLTDSRITCLAWGQNGELWIGTRNGLNRLDPVSHTIEPILPDPAHSQSITAGYISSLFLDSAGRLWVGTFGGGINILTGRDGTGPVFRHIGLKQGLPDSNVNAMLSDKTGRIWVTTDNGVGVVNAQTFAAKALQPADGVAMPTYWARSAAATLHGELLFGGTGGGLMVVRPERYLAWQYSPPIVIDAIRLGGTKLSGNRFNTPGGRERLTVQPDANNLTVEFSALDYAAPENIHYAYRLVGFDRDWIQTDATQRVATYTNLRPGIYILQVRGTNRSGAWSKATLNLTIHVLPAWYQTWLFYIAMALLGIASIAALVDIRTRYLRRRQRDLETLVTQRTAELEESKREIEQIAYLDCLTGLPNRRMFNEDLSIRLLGAIRQGQQFALLLLDFDGFKQINDKFGHDVGDAFLLQAGKRLTAALRRSDVVARLGGDEFAILIGNLPGEFASEEEAVATVCGRVLESFVDPITFDGVEIGTSVSLGVVLCPKFNCTQDVLYKAADLALYEAKRSGKNTWRWHNPESGLGFS